MRPIVRVISPQAWAPTLPGSLGPVLALPIAAALLGNRPNFVLIFADDLGYGDLSCYGQTAYKTPNLDKMAREGTRYTDFLVASPGCSPSRAAILTGCQPVRLGIPAVLVPSDKTGLNLSEQTIPELLKPAGYRSAIVGKWHIGVKNLMPLAHGFDEYFGLPYSNDMWPPHGKNWGELHLYRDNTRLEQIETLADQDTLTTRYTEEAVRFIGKNADRPFFLYLAHSMPHVPLGVSSKFKGKSGAGLYGDVIQELDWSVGEVLKALKKSGIDDNTIVVFTSDNGPWLPYGEHAGSSGGLREGKGTTFEGGVREPCIVRWPGHVPAGKTSASFWTSIDIAPTFASLAGVQGPKLAIDGVDATSLVTGQTSGPTHASFPYYIWPGELQAVREGRWKLHFPHPYRHQTPPGGVGGDSAGEVTLQLGLSLYDLATDRNETRNVAENHPETVARLERLAESYRRELGNKSTGQKGYGTRPPGRVSD